MEILITLKDTFHQTSIFYTIWPDKIYGRIGEKPVENARYGPVKTVSNHLIKCFWFTGIF